jgi:hypothetical protein
MSLIAASAPLDWSRAVSLWKAQMLLRQLEQMFPPGDGAAAAAEL